MQNILHAAREVLAVTADICGIIVFVIAVYQAQK
jgi:hypothetical protein